MGIGLSCESTRGQRLAKIIEWNLKDCSFFFIRFLSGSENDRMIFVEGSLRLYIFQKQPEQNINIHLISDSIKQYIR